MPDLLAQIEAMAVDSTVSLSTLLRKCLVLAHRLNLQDFIDWATFELNGYDDAESTPPYRKTHGICVGTVSNGYYTHSHVPIPVRNLPDDIRKRITNVTLYDSIGAVEKLSQKADDGSMFGCTVPPDVVAFINGKVSFGDTYQIQTANVECSSTFPYEVLEIVRNKVLEFVLKVRDLNMSVDADGALAFDASQETVDKLQQVFNYTFHGNVGGVISGAQKGCEINITQDVRAGNFASLQQALKSIGIDSNSISSLKKAIKADADDERKGIGARVGAWIGDLTTKVATGVVTRLTADKIPVVVAMVTKYLGG